MSIYQARQGGTCARCGASDADGCYWHPAHVILDSGIPGAPPIEASDLSDPVLCDACHVRESAAAWQKMLDEWPPR